MIPFLVNPFSVETSAKPSENDRLLFLRHIKNTGIYVFVFGFVFDFILYC
jgi:hypothetical protein